MLFPIWSSVIIFECIAVAHTLGINCRGNDECRADTGLHSNILDYFNETLSTVNTTYAGVFYSGISTFTFQSGNDIICHKVHPSYVCLFLQGNNVPATVNGSIILQKLGELIEHGCNKCGSVPLSDDNNPDTEGLLTSNKVVSHDCSGYCNNGLAPGEVSGSTSGGEVINETNNGNTTTTVNGTTNNSGGSGQSTSGGGEVITAGQGVATTGIGSSGGSEEASEGSSEGAGESAEDSAGDSAGVDGVPAS